MTRLACPDCSEPGVVRDSTGAATAVGSVAARLERRPVVDCPEGHRLTPPELVDEAMQAVDAQVARARGRLLRQDACAGCGAALTMPARRSRRPVSVATSLGTVLTIELDLPLTRCPSCGLDQVPSRSGEDLVVVIPALFAAPADRDGPAPA